MTPLSERAANADVFGLPYAHWSEAVADELHRHCHDILGVFERPKKIVIVDALPMTCTAKIQKALLRAAHLETYSVE
ncbi:MAG: hypothetical protein I8H77_15745 [Comamonadaceae bacterium]|nr:hypothetical protein [Comamonadaceae bacterium]